MIITIVWASAQPPDVHMISYELGVRIPEFKPPLAGDRAYYHPAEHGQVRVTAGEKPAHYVCEWRRG